MNKGRLMVGGILGVLFLVAATSEPLSAQDRKKGTTTGVVTAKTPTPNGKNIFIEVKAPGEEAARKYWVNYDPKVKGPIPAVLAVVKATNVGDTVKFDWIDTGEGLGITKFEVLKKGAGKEEKKDK